MIINYQQQLFCSRQHWSSRRYGTHLQYMQSILHCYSQLLLSLKWNDSLEFCFLNNNEGTVVLLFSNYYWMWLFAGLFQLHWSSEDLQHVGQVWHLCKGLNLIFYLQYPEIPFLNLHEVYEYCSIAIKLTQKQRKWYLDNIDPR